MEDPDQTASSDLGLPFLSRSFWHTISVRNFRTNTVHRLCLLKIPKHNFVKQ